LVEQFLTLIEGAYQRAPILLLALSALVVLPAVALVSLAMQSGSRRFSREIALRAAERVPEAEVANEEIPGLDTLAPSARQSQGWLTVEGRPGGPMPLAGDLIRIGRQEDNDIRLADRSVHRYHAVIERTADEAFLIKDISGQDGSGVRVNGEPRAEARLADGDMIELGRARLKFENVPV
jgi:pSer/pThr/pTyr-binding forkhead associated (FHA) protein